ncbi:MAG TPA: DUF6456 domain-containing protein [Alphaproteobacteria bacterium]|nr:DUF6456 domain-containing protein [Alphaproteobacteria bacterium]
MTASVRKRRRGPGPDCDIGPAERYRYGDLIVAEPGEEAGATVRRVMTQTMLDRYLVRGQIARRQHDAGYRLYRLWRASGAEPTITGGYGLRAPGSRDRDDDDRAIRRVQLQETLRAIGKQLCPVVIHVCLTDGSAADWARQKNLPKPDGIARLRAGLDALADWWGM